jgi:hypothetical protein
MVRDQEVGGSNPLASTNYLESGTYKTENINERLVPGQDVDASNASVTTILSLLRSMHYVAFSTASSSFILRTTRTTAVVLFAIIEFLVDRLTLSEARVGSEIHRKSLTLSCPRTPFVDRCAVSLVGRAVSPRDSVDATRSLVIVIRWTVLRTKDASAKPRSFSAPSFHIAVHCRWVLWFRRPRRAITGSLTQSVIYARRNASAP